MLITVQFGSDNSEAPVRYTLLNADKTVYRARTGVGVSELDAGSGIYGVQVDDADLAGRTVVWDIDGTAKAASETFASDSPGTVELLTRVPDDLATQLANLPTATETVAMLEEIGSNVNAVKYITGQLDVSAVTQVPASMAGHLIITAGLTFSEPVSGLVIPSDWAKAIWTLKTDSDQPDTASIIQLRTTNPSSPSDGLQRLNVGAVTTPVAIDDGTLTVYQADGRIVVTLTDELTALLGQARAIRSKANALGWDVKFIDQNGESVGRRGTAAIVLTETWIT